MTTTEPFERYLRTGLETGLANGGHFDGIEVPDELDDRIDAIWQSTKRDPTDAETRELYANPAASQSMLADPVFDVVAWLVNDVAATFAGTGLDRFLGGRSRVLRDPYTHKPFVHFYVTRAASGIETEGHDGETRHGAEHESPAPKGDAQP